MGAGSGIMELGELRANIIEQHDAVWVGAHGIGRPI
jgi:hypothetical protein